MNHSTDGSTGGAASHPQQPADSCDAVTTFVHWIGWQLGDNAEHLGKDSGRRPR